MTGSTRKAATNVNGMTLHSVFRLPVQTRFKSYGPKKLRNSLYTGKQIPVLKSFDSK